MNQSFSSKLLKLNIVLALLLLMVNSTYAQSGVSSMSVGATRANPGTYTSDGRFVMPPADMIRIEEFINYHRHEIPMPVGNERVRLSLLYHSLSDKKSIVQFGLSTPRAMDPELVAPLNLVLVIDQSGSMSGERMTHVKEALEALVGRLRKTDKVSIVGFNHTATVLLKATEKTKTKKIKKAIDQLFASGRTNLHEGLMLGYKEAAANFDSERTNRVILLSDGITNTGVVDLDQIARESKAFNQEGIDLSTIGLGQDLNHELLRELADAGRGLIHFVGDSQDIQKTFISEVDSLLAPAARNVRLTLDFGDYADDVKIYGYEPKRKGSKLTFKLDNLNHGATQVVMARIPKKAMGNVKATLKYDDAITNKEVVSKQTIGDESEDEGVLKNYAIALVANSLKKAASKSNEAECSAAEQQLNKGMRAARKIASQTNSHLDGDQDLERVLEIAQTYRDCILESINRRDGRD